MNAPVHLEVLLGRSSEQRTLPLGSEGVLRYVWTSRWGEMLIEVVDGAPHVNGKRVDPAQAPELSPMKGNLP